MTTGASAGRAYERTHPWLTFSIDLKRLQHTGWLSLGEAVSMSGHIAGAPPEPEAAHEMHKLYLAKGALATTAIEGNALSEDEALNLIDGALTLPPSRQYLGREIENIVAACNIFGFAAYALAGLVDGLREQIDSIREHQWDIAWVHFVYEWFRETHGVKGRRQRSLVPALSQVKQEFRIGELPNLNADLAREYDRVARRTLFRDVDSLLRLGLLPHGPNGVRANRERIPAFPP